MDSFIRTEKLLGAEAMERLSRARVAVFGIGGVGGYVCEALVRSGVGAFDLVDDDCVAESNLNRQIIATRETLGERKTTAMRRRMQSINPAVQVREHCCFFLPENAEAFPFAEYDYVVDCVDTVTAKLEIIRRAKEFGVPVISAMGTGNKLDPSRFRVSDIYETSICPLARIMRKELRRRGVKDLKVVWSDEEPLTPEQTEAESSAPAPMGTRPEPKRSKPTPGSTAFCPAVAGLILAAEVVKDLCAGTGEVQE